ncbi:MAG: DUF427 domain-containing protein, partial [Solirubrobacterales bacterium]|nr:DUF427 domain-containing protein [Solirubrobacterales bacterium]
LGVITIHWEAVMSSRQILEPGPDHPISITKHAGHVRVSAAGQVLVDTDAALELREAGHPPVLYLPFDDADASQLERTEHHSYCPYKGEASYFSIPALGERGANTVWQYREPFPAMAEIKDHLAFYPDRVEISQS